MASGKRPILSEQPYSTSSGIVTVGQSPYIVHAAPCVLIDAIVYTDGTNDATLTVYDNATTVTGTVLAQAKAAGADLQAGVANMLRIADNGIAIEIVGTGASALIAYMI